MTKCCKKQGLKVYEKNGIEVVWLDIKKFGLQ